MMMTSGGTVHYKNMFDAGRQIVAKEGTKSLFKGAAANILRGVAGAGVLSLYDKAQEVLFGKVYSGGMSNGFCRVFGTYCFDRLWLIFLFISDTCLLVAVLSYSIDSRTLFAVYFSYVCPTHIGIIACSFRAPQNFILECCIKRLSENVCPAYSTRGPQELNMYIKKSLSIMTILLVFP